MSGHITREEREAARSNVAKGRLCYRCGGPTGRQPDVRCLCSFCEEKDRLAAIARWDAQATK
jgi:hypothetical protein